MKDNMNTIKNQYGVSIVMCCASCENNKDVNNEFTRLCGEGMGIVKTSFLCENYKMREQFKAAGKGGGRVHRHDYNMYMLDEFNKKKTRLQELPREVRMVAESQYPSPEEFAQEWEKEHGSRYLNI
jgi:hypothetical protein